MDKRPTLNIDIKIKDFKEFYWLKAELTKFCRIEGLKTTGSKVEITKRIETYLLTGDKNIQDNNKRKKPSSKFDWNTETLTLNTLITDNYKNTENVRRFLMNNIGNHFKFNVKFMNWMKSNSGKTLNDAINEWQNIYSQAKNSKTKKNIAPQFEYNTYLRDFLSDNPKSNRETGIRLWNIKKSLRGNTQYTKSDFNLLNK